MERRRFTKDLAKLVILFSIPELHFNEDFLFAQKEDIYLTIDDGPRPNMEKILTRLGKENKATFFVVGELLESQKNKDLLLKALEMGHEIGNHSYSHPEFSKISLDQSKKEIETTHELINKIYEKVGKQNPLLFRFPYGDPGYYIHESCSLGNKNHKIKINCFLEEIGYKAFFWSLDSEDWKYYSKEKHKELKEIIENVQNAKQGDNILTHDLPITQEHIIPFYINSQKYNLKTLRDYG